MFILCQDEPRQARPMSHVFRDLETACYLLQIVKQHSHKGGLIITGHIRTMGALLRWEPEMLKRGGGGRDIYAGTLVLKRTDKKDQRQTHQTSYLAILYFSGFSFSS